MACRRTYAARRARSSVRRPQPRAHLPRDKERGREEGGVAWNGGEREKVVTARGEVVREKKFVRRDKYVMYEYEKKRKRKKKAVQVRVARDITRGNVDAMRVILTASTGSGEGTKYDAQACASARRHARSPPYPRPRSDLWGGGGNGFPHFIHVHRV